MQTSFSEPPKLIYVGDPMCSWCYGIAPELEGIKEEYGEQLEYELILGGLRPYNVQTMVELKDFLTDHWEEVAKRSGQEFKFDILDDSSIAYDTEPPCRANMIVRDMDASKAFEFFHKTQYAFYKENRNMHSVESYSDILTELGIDKDLFSTKFLSDQAKSDIKKDFQRAAELGVNSFPTVIISHKGEMYIIAQGYATQKEMSNRIQQILNK